MVDDRPLRRAVEFGVYAPVGLAVLVAENVPDLVEKGRARVEPRLNLARFIGKMVVDQGRREVERRIRSGGPEHPRSNDPVRSTRSVGSTGPVESPGPGRSTGPRRSTGSRRSTGPRRSAGPVESPGPDRVPLRRSATIGASDRPAPAVEDLAIADYESLSAGQVVALLGGLVTPDLDLVEAFESTHRNRRTVLGRIAQLRDAT